MNPETTTDPTTTIADALCRLQATAAALPEECATPDEKLAHGQISAILVDNKFPQRHVGNLPRMAGDGLEEAKRHQHKIMTGDALILLIGDRGKGKTQIATYWAQQRVLCGKFPGRYIKCADLKNEIKAAWARNESEDSVLKKYRTTGYLVIDEFQAKSTGDWESNMLVNLVDHRYDDMKATVLIANVLPEKIADVFNSSIIDRANETGGTVFCDWGGYR